jgi:tetratricopeptide (TPR) repeat protein
MKRILAAVIGVLFAGVSFAAMPRGPTPVGGDANANGPFERAEAAARSGDCRDAISQLVDVLRDAPGNAEAWNLLAYCQRKTGKLDEAFLNYRKALELKPEFPEAREYLGEAHLQAVLREIEILRGYGDVGQKELEQLVAALRETADKAAAGASAKAAARLDW